MNNMLTVEEVKNFLEIGQHELEKFLTEGKLRAYKIGGAYVRFRKEDVLNLRSEYRPKKVRTRHVPLLARIADFWRFNNFYIISLLIVMALAVLVARS